jgi:acetylglutamate kinase
VEPDAEGGSRRTGECELKVRAPLVAGTVERTLVGDLRRHLAAEAADVDRYLGGV